MTKFPNTALDEASLYLHRNTTGYFGIMRADHGSTNYDLRKLARVLQRTASQPDMYVSQAEFYGRERTVTSVKYIGLSFVDLDCYNTDWAQRYRTPEDQAYSVMEFCEEQRIVRPSAILSSGRGLYLKWYYVTPIPFLDLARWNATQQYFVKVFAPFGADPCASHAACLLRPIGTVNSKSETLVRVVTMAPCSSADGVNRWTFDEIANHVLPYTRQECRAHKEEILRRQQQRELRKQKGPSSTGYLVARTFKDLCVARLHDIRTLKQLRGWDTGVPAGCRDIFLFCATHAALALLSSADRARLEYEVESLRREFCPTLSPRDSHNSMGTLIRKELRDEQYKLTNEWLIDRLQISVSEQWHMVTLISHDVRAERHRRKNRTGDKDRFGYEEEQRARRKEAQRLRSTGLPFQEIGVRLGISEGAAKMLVHRESNKSCV